MERQSQSFLATWLVACLLAGALTATLNFLVDPHLLFGMPRITAFNARKPAVDRQERLMKTYDVLRAKPRAIILGTSIADFGLDPHNPEWPENIRPVYNLALAGGGPYISYRYLQYVLSRRKLDLVVFTVDFNFFLSGRSERIPQPPAFEARLAVTANNKPSAAQNRQRDRDRAESLFTLEALTDSVVTMIANRRTESSDLVLGGNWRSDEVRIDLESGAYPRIAIIDAMAMHGLRGLRLSTAAMADVRAVLDLCEATETRVILVINPMHAGYLELLQMAGYWQAFEKWKRDLAALTVRYQDDAGHSSVPLWDFSGYDSYSTETIPEGKRIMRWFLDRLHYTPALGDVITRQIFSPNHPNYGRLLDPTNIEEHLATVRERQQLYREQHPEDVRRVRDLYRSYTLIMDGFSRSAIHASRSASLSDD